MKFQRDEKGSIFVPGDPNYQGVDLKMFQYNKIEGFVPMKLRYINEQCLYYYDISSNCSLVEYLEGKTADYKLIKGIYQSIIEAYRSCRECFLQEQYCLLQPEYIFWNRRRGEWRICYIPGYDVRQELQLETLTQYLLKKINHNDKLCVKFIYGMYELIQQKEVYLEELEQYLVDFLRQEEEGNINREKSVERKVRKKGKITEYYLKKKSSGYGVPDIVEITSHDFRIGRLEDNDLVLPIAQVSRRHAKITVEENKLYLYDCQSTNGTLLNGAKLAGNREVSCREKDVISFGTVSYEINK